MFFILSKTITYLFLPVPFMAICLLVFLLVRNRRIKKGVLILFTLLFFLFTNPFITNQMMRWWEVPATPIAALEKNYDAAVILTGIAATDQEPTDRVHLHKGADRIMHALQLYKIGKVNRLIISGGSGSLLSEDQPTEASQIKKVLLLSGVPENDIILEERSRNTHENALFTAALVRETNISANDLLLVTSAFHMRRALGCFREAGLNPRPYSTDFYSGIPSYTPDSLIIPSDGTLTTWTRLIKEWIGYLAYSLMGYI